MEKTTVFKSNRSQALRLPKAVAFPDDVQQVEVVAIGRVRIITPAGESWDQWFDGPSVSADFMADRAQPASQQRGAFEPTGSGFECIDISYTNA
jgi:antitoxin VapB